MISLRGVVKTYGQAPALAGVTLDVARGECLGVDGPAGSGRTTLLRVLATLVPPTSGTVVVDGLDMVASLFEIRRRVALVTSASIADERLRVEEHARFVAETRNRGRNGDCAASVRKALRRAGLSPTARLESLSSSDRMALGLTTALLARADVLLLDEPFRPFDGSRRALFCEWLSEVRAAGTTIVIATGDDDDARAVCQRVLRLEAGRVVEEPS
jgi:ABC-2 type transport system ATP-binding protein